MSDSRLLASPTLSVEERGLLEETALPPRRLKAHSDLVREGDRAENLFVVTDGWACRYTTTREGARQLPAVMVPGDIGNLDSLMFDRLDYSVRTLTSATVVALPRGRLLTLAGQHPGIARTFTWLAMVDNASLTRRSLSLGRRSAKERVAHLLCELSERLDKVEGNQSNFALPLTQEGMADALGLTTVHVNRTMRELRAEGLVATPNRTMVLPDIARLRRIAGFDPRYLHLNRQPVFGSV